MDPTLEGRLRATDPLAHRTSSDQARDAEWLRRTSRVVVTQEPRSARRALAVAVAVAVLAVSATAGALIVRAAGGDAPDHGVRDTNLTVTEIAMAPDTPLMSSCIPFSIDALADMPMAFSGEVTTRSSDAVLMIVDNWYRGPGTDQVRLLAPDMSLTSVGDVVDFRPGGRYLVTATDGTVNYCGFTALWSQHLADSYAAAFGAGQ